MLNLKEQLEVQRGDLKPNSVEDKLIEITHVSGINFARDFAVTYKVFPTDDGGDPAQSINTLASAYLSKMLSATNRMITADSSAIQSLNNVMASLIANENVATESVILNATLEQWEGFVNNNIHTAFELFAQVRQEEKTEYDAL